MKCRFCNTQLQTEFIDLGYSPPSNSFMKDLDSGEVSYPLKVFVCHNCYLVQLDEFEKANEIFSEDYVYFSSMSSTWLAHSKDYVEMMISEFGISRDSFVMEIASNDGYLLQYFKQEGVKVIGVEPTLSTATIARNKGIESLTEFFGRDFARNFASERGKCNLVLGNNVLAHVPDINDFVSGIKEVLSDDGIVTMEFPHILNLIELNQFDTIYHEHFSYLSFTTVQKIFKSHGMDMFHVQEISTHGGSLRIFAKHEQNESLEVRSTVQKLIEKEVKHGITDLKYYENFQEVAFKIKMDLLNFLLKAKSENKKVAAYGAAAKGNTLLNYAGVKSDLIDFVVDRAESKIGRFLPFSHIPVVEESELEKQKPDFIIILPWNISAEIQDQLEYSRNWGAKFVTFIPDLKII